MSASGPSELGAAERSAALELVLARDTRAPGRARAAVSQLALDLRLDSATMQTLVLLVSEVVSNAVVHSRAPAGEAIEFAVRVSDDALRVSVSDAGSGFTPRQRDPTSIHEGYGLFLVDKAASRWGVEANGRTCVWFELPRAA